MYRLIFLFSLLFLGFNAQAQYTETINSNRPGSSQGAFAVGTEVIELEAGPHYGQDKHNLLDTQTNLFGVDYQLRYGLIWEQLEINLSGNYLSSNQKYTVAGTEKSYKFSNFKSNTLGAKYLIYDPAKAHYFDTPNLYSWKANHSVKWRDLIPAVSIYVGANMMFGDNPYLGPDEAHVSPRFAVITQHNFGSFVFVMNFIADKFGEDQAQYSGIFTLTHAFSEKFSMFTEYQAIKGDFYSDDLFRFGAAFLVTKDLQFDASGLVNFKDTPSRWQVSAGVSYRLDLHQQDEILRHDNLDEKEEKEKKKKDKDEKNEDAPPAENTKDNPGELK